MFDPATAKAIRNMPRSVSSGTTVALLGALNMSNNGLNAGVYPAAATYPRYTLAYGPFSQANALLGQRMTLLTNFGTVGDTSAIMMGRVAQVVAMSPRPDICIVGELAASDALNGVAAATTVARSENIVASLLAAGITVVLQTSAPATNYNTTAMKLVIATANRWVRAQGGRRGVVVADITPVLADPTTGDPATGVTSDGYQLNNRGGQLAGTVLADALRPLVSGTVDLASSNASPFSLTSNAMMLGTGGSVATAAGVTGVCADNFYYAWTPSGGAAVASKVARTDLPGTFWQRTVLTNGATSRILSLQNLITTGFASGDVVRAEAEVVGRGDWTDVRGVELLLQNAAGVKQVFDLLGTPTASPANLPNPSGPWVLRTPTMLLGTETNLLAVLYMIGTAGTIDIGRMRIVKVN